MGGSFGASFVCCVPKCEFSWECEGTHSYLLSQSDHIENLEKERSWKEEEFDFVLQFLRTVLLKRRAIKQIL